MDSALDRACRSAEELLSRCIQVYAHGTTTWVDPSSSWQNVRLSILNMMEQKEGALAFIRPDLSRVMIESSETWQTVCAEGVFMAPNGGRAVRVQYVAPAARCGSGISTGCPPSKTCPPTKCGPAAACAPSSCKPQSSGCCKPQAVSSCCKPQVASACCKPKASSCCPKPSSPANDMPDKVCMHPIPGEFSKPKDCRSAANTPKSCEPTPGSVCVKCPDMFPQSSPAETQDVGPKPVNPTLSQYKYSGEALRACQLPLGPVGGGSIAISGDGGLRQWQMINAVNHEGHVPDSFWAIKCDLNTDTSVSRVLQSDALYDNTGFVPAFAVHDHVVPDGSIDLLKKLPGVPEIEVTAKYPTVEVEYPNSGLPVDVRMTAFNPCIPLDENASGIPTIIFNFEVTNPMETSVQVSLLNSQQNMVGWDGHSDITNEVYNAGYGGNSNSFVELDSHLVGIDMINGSLIDPNSQHYNEHDGHFASAAVLADGDVVSTVPQFDSVQTMWNEFISKEGLSGKGMPGPAPAGRTWNGALSVSRVIPAKSTTTFTFFLAWHFPYRFNTWTQPWHGGIEPPMYVGNKYAALFPTINKVLVYTRDNLDMLTKDTFAFRNAMFDSTLPWQLIDSAAGRVSVIRSPTCMWLGDGRFYAFEGCSPKGGCCPLNCTHVWNYEQALCQLWPRLEQTMRDVDLGKGRQVTPKGRMMSRVDLPLLIRPGWVDCPDFDLPVANQYMCVDGEMGGVLKLYREYRFGMATKEFKPQWETAKTIMKRWMTFNDQGDGTMKIAQPSTYDTSLYGVNTFIGAMYLCGLRASEEMAKANGETDLASEFRGRYEIGREALDRKCFTNNQWYTQEVDPEHAVQVVSDSTFVDCLLGQWWGYILDLGDILPFDHCQSTVVNTYARNHKEEFIPSEQAPRQFFDQRDSGLVICTWPDGPPPKNRLLYSTECAWTGLAHYFASLCIYLGAADVGLQVLEDSRNSYDGTRRSPWNEIECGDHYSRPMCAFQLFPTASGLTFDTLRDSKDAISGFNLGFGPRLCATDFSGFFILPTGWGQYKQTITTELVSGTAAVVVSYGEVIVHQLNVPFVSSSITAALSNGTGVVIERIDQTTSTSTVVFTTPVKVTGGLSLNLVIGSSQS